MISFARWFACDRQDPLQRVPEWASRDSGNDYQLALAVNPPAEELIINVLGPGPFHDDAAFTRIRCLSGRRRLRLSALCLSLSWEIPRWIRTTFALKSGAAMATVGYRGC